MNKQNLAVILVVAAVLVIGGYYLGTKESQSNVPQTREFTLKVVGKKLVEGSGELKANENDTVVIHITSDEAEELHLHGYDKSVDLEPNTEATLSLTANASGHFPFELEHSKTELGALDVQPN